MLSRLSAVAAPLPRTFWWLWAGVLVMALATFVFPFLALYLTAHGFDAQHAGFIVSLYGFGALLGGPVGGGLADRFGRRPVLLLALFGSAAIAVSLGAVTSAAWIAPGVFVFGACSMIVFPSVNAAVADLLPQDEVQRGYNLLYWAQNTGIAVSALAGGLLAARSWKLLFWSDAATTILFAALVFRRVPESRPQGAAAERGWAHVFRDRALVAFVATQVLFLLVWWQFQFAAPIVMQRQGLPPSSFGALLGTNCVLLLVLQPILGKRIAKVDPGRLLAASSLLVGLGYGAYALCATTPQYLAATAVWSFGELLGLPAASAVVAQLAPADLRGRYQGLYVTTFSAGVMVAPIVSGFVLDRFGPRPLWLGCLALGIAVSALHLALGRVRRSGSGL